jgi:hypothetical protein
MRTQRDGRFGGALVTLSHSALSLDCSTYFPDQLNTPASWKVMIPAAASHSPRKGTPPARHTTPATPNSPNAILLRFPAAHFARTEYIDQLVVPVIQSPLSLLFQMIPAML